MNGAVNRLLNAIGKAKGHGLCLRAIGSGNAKPINDFLAN
jgi:hypothetical protein